MVRVWISAVTMTLAVAGGALADDVLSPLSMNGIGPLKVGAQQEIVERYLHDKLPYNQYANHGCSTVSTQQLEPTGLSFMLEKKILTRINVDYYGTDPRPLEIKTDTGVGLGSSEDDVRKAYPGAVVKPNPADPTWHTIVMETPDHTRGIIFETDGKTVKSMRAGENPAINYANGCN